MFLSALESGEIRRKYADIPKPMLWNLLSFYYVRNDPEFAEQVREDSRLVLIDSGAHTLQKGVKVKWEEYTHQYSDFIRRYDRPNVLGYFEMDVDNIIGYDRVLKLREILQAESNHPEKIIPVWHKNRGIEDFEKMCEEHSGRIVAITGFRGVDIKESQLGSFLKLAKKYECKMHCLGMTKHSVLDKVPFDFVDSSSWKSQVIFGRIGQRKISRDYSASNRADAMLAAYKEAMKTQLYYFNKWRKVWGDKL